MTEQTQITVTRYRDNEGNPTCALNFATGEVCRFMRTQRYGCNETCVFAPELYSGYTACMERRSNGNGRLIPGEWCPLFETEKTSITGKVR